MDKGSGSREGEVGEEMDYGSMKRTLLLRGGKSCCQILHQEHLIYRVPPVLRNGTEGAFDPHIVSIGPYHRDAGCVKAMKEHKKRYLHDLLSRNSPSEASFEDLARMLTGIEEKTRRSYTENLDSISRKEFVEMMCLDGGFIVEFFLKIIEKNGDELLTGPMWRPRNILRDMLLLENQLPFFVLKEIYLFVKPNEDPTQLVEHCLKIFENYKEWTNLEIPATKPEFIHHLLHLFHKHILPFQTPKKNKATESTKSNDLPLFYRKTSSRVTSTIQVISNTHVNSMPCATGLAENRVKLKKKEGDSFLEITFRHRVLEIPYLLVDDQTETMFRNFIALEQCCLNTHSHRHQFSAYIRLMDSIVNTQKDVELLRRARIMEHGLGSDKEVARLFNRLNKGVIVNLNDSYLSDVFNRVDMHCNKIHNQWIADFKHRYFTSPWACIAMAAAVLGLSLTILTALINISNYTWLRRPHK